MTDVTVRAYSSPHHGSYRECVNLVHLQHSVLLQELRTAGDLERPLEVAAMPRLQFLGDGIRMYTLSDTGCLLYCISLSIIIDIK